jgi:hypothetical protein
MTDRRYSHEELDSALRTLTRTIEIPPPPDYAERVVAQLADGAVQSRSHARISRFRGVRSQATRRLLVAAALLLFTAAVTVAVPVTRHAWASLFGFTGIDIRTAPGSSSQLPASPAPLAAGRAVSLPDAQRAARNRIGLPAQLPPPDQVFLRRDDGAVVVTLAYRTAGTLAPTPDTGYALLITEIFDAGDPLLEKILHSGATTTPVRIHGRPGVFVHGPQEIINVDHSRTDHGVDVVYEVAPRASADTLIWSDSAGTYRLEGDFTQPVAVGLANSFP